MVSCCCCCGRVRKSVSQVRLFRSSVEWQQTLLRVSKFSFYSRPRQNFFPSSHTRVSLTLPPFFQLINFWHCFWCQPDNMGRCCVIIVIYFPSWSLNQTLFSLKIKSSTHDNDWMSRLHAIPLRVFSVRKVLVCDPLMMWLWVEKQLTWRVKMSLAAHEMMYIQFLIFLFLLHQPSIAPFYGSSFVGHKMKLRVKQEEARRKRPGRRAEETFLGWTEQKCVRAL